MANHDFTGVFIPAHIWLSKELEPAEKMLLGEIEALSKKTGWCSAGRKHFSEWLNCSEPNVSYYTSKLAKHGFIEIDRSPGFGSKMRVVASKFYTDNSAGVVNPVYGGSKPSLRGVVNPVYGGSKPSLPVNTIERELESKEEEKENASLSSSTFGAEKEKRIEVDCPAPQTDAVRLYDPQLPGVTIVEPAPMPQYQADPRSNAPAPIERVSISDEIESLKTDAAAKEAFTLSRKIPSSRFEEYVEAFKIDIAGRGETYPNVRKFRAHFFNWAGIRWEIDKKKPEPPKNPTAKPFQYRQI